MSSIEGLGTGSDIAADSASAACIGTVKSWIGRCGREHDCYPAVPHFLPRRVIDVGFGPPYPDPRLYEPYQERAHYVALSHCWGKKQSLTTERATLRARRQGFSLSVLPKTFRDAIYVTRELGIRFIWIDSICIIQDDRYCMLFELLEGTCLIKAIKPNANVHRLDWEIESSKMAAIYKSSYLTIAAALAPDDHHGFLQPRNRSVATIYQHKTVNSSTDIHVRQAIDHYDQPQPLCKRAWAFQERYVSRRVVSYRAEELVWHCMDAKWCECAYTDYNIRHYVNAGAVNQHGALLWDHIVPKYARLDLTKRSDRLPALSAIAKIVQDELGSPYLAGLWQTDLLWGLTWRCSVSIGSGPDQTTRTSPGELPHQYRAPSWCWPSIEGPISYGRTGVACLKDTHVLSAQCTPAGANPLGEVSDGHVRISGPSVSVMLVISAFTEGMDETEVLYQMWPTSPVTYNLDSLTGVARGFRPDVPLVNGTGLVTSDLPEDTIARSNILPGQERPPVSGRVWCLCVSDSSRYWDNYHNRCMLVLGRSSKVVGAFERLGLVDAEWKLGELDDVARFWYDLSDTAEFTIV